MIYLLSQEISQWANPRGAASILVIYGYSVTSKLC